MRNQRDDLRLFDVLRGGCAKIGAAAHGSRRACWLRALFKRNARAMYLWPLQIDVGQWRFRSAEGRH